MGSAGNYKGKHFTEWVEKVKDLKRASNLDEASDLLANLVAATEAENRVDGYGVAPWYYEQIAIICRKQKDLDGELAILERYEAQAHAPGQSPPEMASRLRKVRDMVAIAAEALAPPACPACGTILNAPPSRPFTCAECGEKIILRRQHGHAILLSEQQDLEKNAADQTAREYERMLLKATKIGATEAEFVTTAEELTAQFGHRPKPTDVYWALANRLSLEAAQYGNWSTAQYIYRNMATQTRIEGRDWMPPATEAAKADFRRIGSLDKSVRHFYLRCPCDTCQAMPFRHYTREELAIGLPVPHQECQRPPCSCLLSAERDDDGGVAYTLVASTLLGGPHNRPKGILRRLFGG